MPRPRRSIDEARVGFIGMFINALTEHYGATECTRTSACRVFSNPFRSDESGAPHIFVTNKGHIKHGSSPGNSLMLSDAWAQSVATRKAKVPSGRVDPTYPAVGNDAPSRIVAP